MGENAAGEATTPFDGLLLDVDDTLVDTRAAMVAAGTAAVAALWPDVAPEVHRAAGTHFHQDPGGYFTKFTTGEMAFAEMRAARVAEMVRAHGLTEVADVATRFEEAYRPAFRDSVRLFEDVEDLLEQATAAGIRVGALTNSDERATAHKLELSGLSQAFVTVMTTDTLGFGKPDPRVFAHACELLGVAPERTLCVGDHVEVDALAATRAGLHGVWLRRPGPGSPRREELAADDEALARAHGIPVVSSLAEVGPILTGGHASRPERPRGPAGLGPGGASGPDLGGGRAGR
ncbi:MAG TPA: HAD family hydrolase [Segeticoccus sp.]|uniref:HAD family hydrolase n=1 Tax=Segeticoccus sp. TaxID=2706531 RepID=UPI002D80BDC8|nr:HAD family hydrolase [Segeticoccus sp.]HET8599809.1 HAD family hydrolase [Segeticoccus sp.]